MRFLRILTGFGPKQIVVGLAVMLALGAVQLTATAANAQTADGTTPADELFCDDNFDGQLRGLCNAFCEAMDCDSLNAQASANACIKMEEKIAPLLEEDNAAYGPPDLEITMANPMTQTEGHCGVAIGYRACTLHDSFACYLIGKVPPAGNLCFGPENTGEAPYNTSFCNDAPEN